MESSEWWLTLTVLAHPIAAIDATDGYSILLTPGAENTELDMSISVSEESTSEEQSLYLIHKDNVKGVAKGGRGLQNFAYFQYSDALVAY